MTTQKINKKGKPFIIDDFNRTNQVTKIINSNKQWKQRYSFKNNNGIQVTKFKNNKKQ